jgi:signal transduction histidine kinase
MCKEMCTKTRGSGLGLTLVYEIVMNHGGKIQMESRKGEGKKVTLRLLVKDHDIQAKSLPE